mmetsp:Transcript_28541/g.43147  ORF Transcript_28541/g.43147 Transcript_28541/m.43147 type:complete len:160 (+) Transcript_28541:7577-8056(+)
MRCARLLSYLMVEFQVPLVVRHAIRCAKIFFFGLVNFENLKLYDKFGMPTTQEMKEESALSSCVANKFILHALKKIGVRISCTDQPLEVTSPEKPKKEEEAKEEEPKAEESKAEESKADGADPKTEASEDKAKVEPKEDPKENPKEEPKDFKEEQEAEK